MSGHSSTEKSGDPAHVPAHGPGNFDFEGWRKLAADDPAAYFDARRWAIDAFIAAAPVRSDELRQLQNQLDAMRASAGSPLKAVWQITGMMQDHVELLGHQLDVLKRETDRLRARIAPRSSR